MRPVDSPSAKEADAAAPALVVFCGMTASGKSTLAAAWAAQAGAPHWNTDRVRKELVGLRATDRRPDAVGQGIYTASLSELTYRTMLERAREDLDRGESLVLLDGSYARRQDRDAVRALARQIGARCGIVFCTCSEEETRRRFDLRLRDAAAVSDGRWEIYQHQLRTFERPDPEVEPDCLLLDTTGKTVEEMLAWLKTQSWTRV
ncbi:MAG: AAA family ATPase [Desulfobulbus sp.]|jgi:predicted kinase